MHRAQWFFFFSSSTSVLAHHQQCFSFFFILIPLSRTTTLETLFQVFFLFLHVSVPIWTLLSFTDLYVSSFRQRQHVGSHCASNTCLPMLTALPDIGLVANFFSFLSFFLTLTTNSRNRWWWWLTAAQDRFSKETSEQAHKYPPPMLCRS